MAKRLPRFNLADPKWPVRGDYRPQTIKTHSTAMKQPEVNPPLLVASFANAALVDEQLGLAYQPARKPSRLVAGTHR